MCITQVQIYDYTHSCGHKCGSDTLQSIAPYPIALARRESSSDQSFSCSNCPEIIYTYPVDPCEGCKRHGRWIWDFDVYDFVQVAVEDLSVGVGGADMDVEYVEDNLPSWNTMQVSQIIHIPTHAKSRYLLCSFPLSPNTHDRSRLPQQQYFHIPPLPTSMWLYTLTCLIRRLLVVITRTYLLLLCLASASDIQHLKRPDRDQHCLEVEFLRHRGR